MLNELRVLDGPNPDIVGPAIRLTLSGPGEAGVDLCDVVDRIARAADAFVGPAVSRTGADGTVVVAFPWSHEGTGEALGEALVEVLHCFCVPEFNYAAGMSHPVARPVNVVEQAREALSAPSVKLMQTVAAAIREEFFKALL